MVPIHNVIFIFGKSLFRRLRRTRFFSLLNRNNIIMARVNYAYLLNAYMHPTVRFIYTSHQRFRKNTGFTVTTGRKVACGIKTVTGIMEYYRISITTSGHRHRRAYYYNHCAYHHRTKYTECVFMHIIPINVKYEPIREPPNAFRFDF